MFKHKEGHVSLTFISGILLWLFSTNSHVSISQEYGDKRKLCFHFASSPLSIDTRLTDSQEKVAQHILTLRKQYKCFYFSYCILERWFEWVWPVSWTVLILSGDSLICDCFIACFLQGLYCKYVYNILSNDEIAKLMS